MDFRFSDEKLHALYTQGEGAKQYPPGVVDSFLRRVRTISEAKDVQDLRSLGSLHFEKLKGDFKGKYSVRLKDRWRLILALVQEKSRTVVAIEEITNHYGD